MVTSRMVKRRGNSVERDVPGGNRIHRGVEIGQDLTPIELAVGVKLVKRNVQLERQMEFARDVLREQADALQELAKR